MFIYFLMWLFLKLESRNYSHPTIEPENLQKTFAKWIVSIQAAHFSFIVHAFIQIYNLFHHSTK